MTFSLVDAVALSILAPSPVALRRWLDADGSPSAVLASRARGAVAAKERDAAVTKARREIESCAKSGVSLVTEENDDYPALLREIPDRPVVLYRRGRIDERCPVGVVGARKADAYGLRTAESFARDLAAAGCNVVSGLAYGIDAAAHRGALAAGGPTTAVLGSGLGSVYPRENRSLADSIVASGGAVMSEFPLDAGPARWTFPRRNRIIAGMTRGVLVVEAAARSGALITARLAVEYDRLVWAAPNRVGEELGEGVTALLRDGATAVGSARDLLEDLAPILSTPRSRSAAPAAAPADPMLAAIAPDGSTVAEIAARSGVASSELHARLLRLELAGRIAALPGGIYRLTGF